VKENSFWHCDALSANFCAMAWRIDKQVIRGEIDNRTPGRVTGWLWFLGRDEPVELDLEGNAGRDVAGHRLRFSNPQPEPDDLEGLATLQKGSVGDFTASRKVKIPDCPIEEIGEYSRRDEMFPWHWGNSLYFEWFSERNGRVVIEATNYELELIAEVRETLADAEDDGYASRHTACTIRSI
jgi:hypothetical protein